MVSLYEGCACDKDEYLQLPSDTELWYRREEEASDYNDRCECCGYSAQAHIEYLMELEDADDSV